MKYQVGCIVYCKFQDGVKYLLLKRTQEKGGFWQYPCGKVEKTDVSLKDAIMRELYEEVNITEDDVNAYFDSFFKFTIDKHYLTNADIEPIEESVFAIEIDMKTNLSLDNNLDFEHTEFSWFSYDEVLLKLKWNENKLAFQKFNSLLIR